MYNSVVIFGGSFDPPHLAHKDIIFKAIEELQPDQLLVIPSYIHPTKENKASFYHRVEMCKIAFEKIDGVTVSDIEAGISKGSSGLKAERSYTVDTLTHIRELYPESTFHYILGSDSYASLPNWRDYLKIAAQTNFLVILREEDTKESTMDSHRENREKLSSMNVKDMNDIEGKVDFITIPKNSTSSTSTRLELKKIRSSDGDSENIISLDKDVYGYIESHRLY